MNMVVGEAVICAMSVNMEICARRMQVHAQENMYLRPEAVRFWEA